MKNLLSYVLAAAIAVGAVLATFSIAAADDGSGSGSAVVAAPADGSGSAATPAPHEQLHDPVTQPGATWDDLKAAKKAGWSVLAFAIALLLARVLGKYGPKVFSSLGKGRVAVVIAGVGVALGACYDTIALGGSWVAIVSTLVVAIATFMNSHAEWAPPPAPSKG